MSVLNILVIDDDFVGPRSRQQWFAQRLTAFGHRTTSAHSSSDAYRLFREHRYDLAFFDHDLGETIDGSAIADEILWHPEEYQCPHAVVIHSLNSIGAANIESKFRSARVPTRVLNFTALSEMRHDTFWGLVAALLSEAGVP